jgi:hypothetical protein
VFGHSWNALGLTYMDNIHPMDGMESSTILLILSLLLLLLLLSNVSPMPNKTRNKAQQNIMSFFLLQNSRWELGGQGKRLE